DAAVENERRVAMTGNGLDRGVDETTTATAIDHRDVPRTPFAVDDELDVDPALVAVSERFVRVDERRRFDEPELARWDRHCEELRLPRFECELRGPRRIAAVDRERRGPAARRSEVPRGNRRAHVRGGGFRQLAPRA